AQDDYHRGNGRYAAVGELVAAKWLANPSVQDRVWASTFEAINYRFEFMVIDDGRAFAGYARPLRWYGDRPPAYYVGHDGKLRWSRAEVAGPADAELGVAGAERPDRAQP